MHRKIDIPLSITEGDLYLISEAFNRLLSGVRLEEIGRHKLKTLRDELKLRRGVIDKVLEAIDLMLEGSSQESVVINGALNILNEPEFKDLDKLKRILTILEEDYLLKQVIPEKVGEDVNITIGKENKLEDIQEMSLVIAGYHNLGELGKMGVIGPIRMEYWKAAGTVESLRNFLNDALNKGHI